MALMKGLEPTWVTKFLNYGYTPRLMAPDYIRVTHILFDTHLDCQLCQNVKRWQVVKKISNVKKSNNWTMEEVHKKINWHNEVHRYWCQFWCHIWWSLKSLKMFIESIFDQFWWTSYVTSKLTSISVNLIVPICNRLNWISTWLKGARDAFCAFLA